MPRATGKNQRHASVRRKLVGVALTTEQFERLTTRARLLGMSRSSVVATLIHAYLERAK